jgi:hypothetical protein
MGRESLPQGREPQRPNAQRGKAIEIVESICMTRPFELIEVPISHAVDGALDATPKFQT